MLIWIEKMNNEYPVIFYTISANVIFISQIGLLLSSIVHIIIFYTDVTQTPMIYYIWAICSLFQVISLLQILESRASSTDFFGIIGYSLRSIKPFLIVVLYVYLAFAQLGIGFFGG